jgi:hypothetical protein
LGAGSLADPADQGDPGVRDRRAGPLAGDRLQRPDKLAAVRVVACAPPPKSGRRSDANHPKLGEGPVRGHSSRFKNSNPVGLLKVASPIAVLIGKRIWAKRLLRIKQVLETSGP